MGRRWHRLNNDLTDSERAAYAAARIRRYIDCYDLLRRHRSWISIHEIAEELNVQTRQVRRTLHHLEASGVIEVLWGLPTKGEYGRSPSMARMLTTKKTPVERPSASRVLSRRDQKRIVCQDTWNLNFKMCGKPAVFVENASGASGSGSFFYWCPEHAAATLNRRQDRQRNLAKERARRELRGSLIQTANLTSQLLLDELGMLKREARKAGGAS